MPTLRNSKKGLTLVELILTLILASLIIGGITMVLVTTMHGATKGQTNAVAYQETRVVEKALQQALFSAGTISVGSLSGNGTEMSFSQSNGLTIRKAGVNPITTNEASITGIVLTPQTILKPGSSSVLRCVLAYQITSKYNGSTYTVSGSVVLNNIADASLVLSGRTDSLSFSASSVTSFAIIPS